MNDGEQGQGCESCPNEGGAEKNFNDETLKTLSEIINLTHEATGIPLDEIMAAFPHLKMGSPADQACLGRAMRGECQAATPRMVMDPDRAGTEWEWSSFIETIADDPNLAALILPSADVLMPDLAQTIHRKAAWALLNYLRNVGCGSFDTVFLLLENMPGDRLIDFAVMIGRIIASERKA